MEVVVRSRNIPLSKALEAHCHERLRRAVEPFAAHVGRAQALLVDVNGPRRGLGQECHVLVELSDGKRIRFARASGDFYAAATCAASGAGRHLARELGRSRDRKHDRKPVLT